MRAASPAGGVEGGWRARRHGSLDMTVVEIDLLNFLNGLAWRAMRVMRVFTMIIGGLASAGLAAALAGCGAAGGAGTAALSEPVALAAATAAVPAVGNPAGHQPVPAAGQAVNTSHPNHVIGHGTPAGCTSAAVVRAVAEGGVITFDCGPKPVTIQMTATAKVVNTSHRVVLDGGGKVTLSGRSKIRILYMDTCDPKQKYTTDDCWEQQWPQLVVQNINFVNAYSAVRETAGVADYGGGAIFDEGGQLKVVNAAFIDNRCYASGPDLGGAAVRALGMYPKTPVYVTHDTFTGNSCSNGAALSGLFASFYVVNSLMTNNKATGNGANPAGSGTPGGGSGGAIYNDGDNYNVTISGTVMTGNVAPEGGDAIFFVVDSGGGTLKIEYSTLHNDHKSAFQDAHDQGIFSEVDGVVTPPVVIHSTIN
jgi:hypothetical protein